jgi:predicted transposase YdaD
MPLLIDLSNDPFFVEQFRKHEAEARAKGEAKGEAKGKAEVIIGLLETGRFSVEEIAVFAKVPITFVLEAQKQYVAQQALLLKKK